MEEYAINIYDLTRDEILAQWLIGPLVENRIVVDCEPDLIDGRAVLLECDPERAAAVVQVIRKRWPRHLLRCYCRKKGRKKWQRI